MIAMRARMGLAMRMRMCIVPCMTTYNFKDLTGRKIGDATVVGPAGLSKRHRSLWLVRFADGTEKIIRTDQPRPSAARRPVRSDYARHGMRDSPEYRVWQGMVARCINPRVSGFKYYGGRGITVCERWRDSFLNFLADMGTRPEGLTLDRINNDGNYEPGNCRWASWSVQNANKRKPTRQMTTRAIGSES
jgi:hypothetical protein